MAQCILIDHGDAVSITHPVGVTIGEIEVALIMAQTPYSVVEKDSIPPSRVFRSAWRCLDGALVVDMALAKEIQRDRWRAARAPLLRALDVAWMRAEEAGDEQEKAAIAAQKQTLRDVTETDLSGVTTPEELEAFWPAPLTQQV